MPRRVAERDYEDGEDVATLSRPIVSRSLFGDKTPAVWQCSTRALDSIGPLVSDLRCTDFEDTRYRVYTLPCIGGSLVLTLLHGLVLYSTEAEIG